MKADAIRSSSAVRAPVRRRCWCMKSPCARFRPTVRVTPSCGFTPTRRALRSRSTRCRRCFAGGSRGGRSSGIAPRAISALDERIGNLDRRSRRPGARREDSRQGIRHDLSQRVFANPVFVRAGRADAVGAGRRRPEAVSVITISIRPGRATGPTFCSVSCAIRCRGSRWKIQTTTRGCCLIRSTTPQICQRSI